MTPRCTRTPIFTVDSRSGLILSAEGERALLAALPDVLTPDASPHTSLTCDGAPTLHSRAHIRPRAVCAPPRHTMYGGGLPHKRAFSLAPLWALHDGHSPRIVPDSRFHAISRCHFRRHFRCHFRCHCHRHCHWVDSRLSLVLTFCSLSDVVHVFRASNTDLIASGPTRPSAPP